MDRDGAGGPGSLFSFHMAASIGERIPLLQYAGSIGNEGASRVGFTRGELCHAAIIHLVGG
jgi:hypothetical protein